MNINWFSKIDKSSFATIYKTNITINKVASLLIEDAYKCQIGLDKESKAIYIKPISKQKYDSNTLDEDSLFNLSVSKTYCRISSTDFVNLVSTITKIDYTLGKKKYSCSYLKDENMLKIDLTKELE